MLNVVLIFENKNIFNIHTMYITMLKYKINEIYGFKNYVRLPYRFNK